MINLNYVKDHILYQIFLRLFWINYKKHGKTTDNILIRIYINKIENSTAFEIKTAELKIQRVKMGLV